jgi:hypothetical protein
LYVLERISKYLLYAPSNSMLLMKCIHIIELKN